MNPIEARSTEGRSQGSLGGRARFAALLALIGVSAIWGATFPLMHDAIVGIPTLSFLQLRFLLATVAVVPVALARGKPSALLHARCVAPGLMLAAGYALQTEGLRTTSPSISAFLTGTSVVIVPAVGALLGLDRGGLWRWTAVVLALGGIFFLQGARLPDRWSSGESATMLCAVAFAGQILLVGRSAARAGDPFAFAAGQIVVATLGLLLAGIVRGELFVATPIRPGAWFAALFTGLLATALAYWVQTWAQRRVSSGVAAVCFASEPAFAAVVSVFFYGDRLAPLAWAGAASVAIATLLTVIAPNGRPRSDGPRFAAD